MLWCCFDLASFSWFKLKNPSLPAKDHLKVSKVKGMFCVSLNSATAPCLNYTWFHEWQNLLFLCNIPLVPSLNLSLLLSSARPPALCSHFFTSAGNSWLVTRCHLGDEPGENTVVLFKSSCQRPSFCLTQQNENKYRCVYSFWILFELLSFPLNY